MATHSLTLPALWGSFRARIVGRRFTQNVGVLTIANLAGAALSFTQGILVARWLGPELYGIAALIMSYPSLVYVFFDARSGDASVRFLSEFHAREERDRVLAMCKLGYVVDLSIASVAFLVVAVSSQWAASSIAKHPDAAGLIVIYAAAFVPRALLGTSRAVLTVLGRFRLVAVVESAMTVLRVALILSLVLSGWQVAGLVWGNAVVMIASGLIFAIIAWAAVHRTWKAFPFQGDWRALQGRRREIFGFLAYSDLGALLGMIPKHLDLVILGYVRGPAEAGYYKLAKSLAAAVGYLVGPLQSVSYPELIRLSALKNTPALVQKVCRLAFRVGIPLGLVVVAGASTLSYVLPVLLGQQYLPAVQVAQLMFVASAIWLAFFWLRPVYLSIGNIKHWTAAIGLYAIAFLALSIPLTVQWGYLGMTLSSSLAVVVFHLVMASRLFFILRHGAK